MTKTPTPTEQSKKQRDNIKRPPKTLITQLLRTDLGRSVGVTAVTQLVWLNRLPSAVPVVSLLSKVQWLWNVHIITNLRLTFYHLLIFIVIVINTSSYLYIQNHWEGMYPIHLVILNRLSPHTFYTEQSLKMKTKCDRSLSTMRS